jgi:methionyl aminopeptidase
MEDDVKEKYLKAGAIAARVRKEGAGMIKPGALLLDVAEFVEDELRRQGGKPAFPVNLAINNIAAHYTPCSGDDWRFVSGDLVKLDVGVHVDGYIADTALTVEVVTGRWAPLIDATRDSLEMVLESIAPGMMVRTIGATIERVIRAKGFEPVSNLTGHSLERYNLHAGLSVPNIDDKSIDDLKPGMAVAIEPFATNGAGRVAGRKSGNIYKLLRMKETGDMELDELVKRVHDEFRFMPFPERWVAKNIGRPEKALKKLLRQGIFATYPILSEVKGGMVSQYEHTVIFAEGRAIVTTR